MNFEKSNKINMLGNAPCMEIFDGIKSVDEMSRIGDNTYEKHNNAQKSWRDSKDRLSGSRTWTEAVKGDAEQR